jgi:hypothetical protein
MTSTSRAPLSHFICFASVLSYSTSCKYLIEGHASCLNNDTLQYSPQYTLRGSKQLQLELFDSPHVRIQVPRMPHGPDYWKDILIIVPVVCTAFATFCYGLRIYSRLKVLHGLRVEDILMGAGLICTYGVAACTIYCKFTLGFQGMKGVKSYPLT